ncbi:MAG: hypothetical protein ACKVX9_11220 [Blastocatellia bacterium]
MAVQYPISLRCDLLDALRGGYYHESVEPDESRIRQAIEDIASEFPTYGSMRISAQLRIANASSRRFRAAFDQAAARRCSAAFGIIFQRSKNKAAMCWRL